MQINNKLVYYQKIHNDITSHRLYRLKELILCMFFYYTFLVSNYVMVLIVQLSDTP